MTTTAVAASTTTTTTTSVMAIIPTQTQTTITRAQTTITLAEEEREVKKQAQAKARRAKRQTRDEAHHVLVRAANIQMIRNMPETDAALTKRPERKGENGGDGLKIGFYRAQTNKVAKKLVRQGVRQDDGSIKRTGAVIREKGDLYLVDCNVTGSSEGTPDDPKFALKKLFEHHIFQTLDGLVGAGGQYEGYIPVIQGDNAGPHAEKEYFNWCKAQCEQRGWHWESQAPQMPHMNNLDLSVFPCMSRRHCAAARERGGLHVLKQDEIWDAAEDVWRTLPSSKIASGFVQCSRIASKVIALEGGIDFVGNEIENGIHCDIRKDYNETPTGLSRKDGEMINPPAPATAI